ncbi:MAG: LacI family DNA-binding transcriptional regulator [Rhodospirillales bacterium]|nr:LacI family DNA-binding transcriptional regulator [Acetobacter sp.]
MNRVTLRDIARVAGVSHVTVSLALRGHRSIPPLTRGRIEQIAKQLGYRPDPALSALMIYRRGAKPSGYQGTLAWINNYRDDPNRLMVNFRRYFLGAQQRCAELGYQLEEFRMVDLDLNFKRLAKILRARSIQGLLFPPQGRLRHISLSAFDWEDFSLLAFGFTLQRPQLDLVTNAQYRTARIAMRKLRSLGYRRIGFVAAERELEQTDQNFLAGYLVAQRHYPPSECPPIHLVDKKNQASAQTAFLAWFRKYEPDVILMVTPIAADWLHAMSPAKRKGCGYALLDVPDDDPTTSGMNQNNLIIGRTAVDILISKIHANERGIPAVPRRTLIEGRWMDGKTAPRVIGTATARHS